MASFGPGGDFLPPPRADRHAEPREMPQATFLPMESLRATDSDRGSPGQRADGLRSPRLPNASPLGSMACPLGQAMSPHLTTPQFRDASGSPTWPPAQGSPPGPAKGPLGGLGSIDAWAWEVGSEVGSVPSAWSKATSSRTGKSAASKMSSASGVEGLIPGLVDGQRLSSVSPARLPTRGGKVVVSLRKEVPQGYWDTLSIVLVNLPVSLTLKPTGIKKGKKLCIEVPTGLTPDDYDVRLKFGEKIIHGSIPLSIRDDDDEDPMDDDGDLTKDLADDFKSLIK